jgi:adenosyl cobinamide kinase/adenosyl cobinamide phosphate guanylyltransferase
LLQPNQNCWVFNKGYNSSQRHPRRRYRDLVDRCNQLVAARADQVFLVACGIAQQIK